VIPRLSQCTLTVSQNSSNRSVSKMEKRRVCCGLNTEFVYVYNNRITKAAMQRISNCKGSNFITH